MVRSDLLAPKGRVLFGNGRLPAEQLLARGYGLVFTPIAKRELVRTDTR